MIQSKNLKGKNIPSDMVLCRWCKEPIMANDKLCKHCNEYQNDIDLKASEKEQLSFSTLSVSDWMMIILFQWLGIMVGGYYCLNGENSRGIRLIKYSSLSFVVGLILNGFIIYSIYYFIKLLKLVNVN